MNYLNLRNTLTMGKDLFLPNLSIDCVVLGFHQGSLKILLNKVNIHEKWMLPGGFVYKDEDLELAASRILKQRTSLYNVYLRQFRTFGQVNRIEKSESLQMLKHMNIDSELAQWYLERFISCSYYAFIEYEKAEIKADEEYEEIRWFSLDQLPKLYGDHYIILDTAIQTLRKQLGNIPIGFELLPEKFTMPELRSIYEAILGRKLDRRNFQRKMLSLDVFITLDEKRKIGAHKSPKLYSFDKEKYEKALEFGFSLNY